MKGEKDADMSSNIPFKKQLSSERATEYIETQKRILAMREYAMAIQIGRTSAESLNFERSEDFITKQLIERLSVDVLSDHIVDDSYKARYRYTVYSSWWQHLKHDHAPRWFIKRFPVVKERKSGYVNVKFDRYAEYPKANIALQNNMQFFEVNLGGFERLYDTVSQLED